MQSKISVILLKAKNIDEKSDINKMAVHLEQILSEREGVDLKARQSITEAGVKSADFIVFCGYDSSILGEFFRACGVIESMKGEDKSAPTLFLYDEPGESVMEFVNYILRRGSDLGRVDSSIFEKIVDTWTHNDIIGTIDLYVRKLLDGAGTSTKSNTPASEQ
jgi:hypothetical protein